MEKLKAFGGYILTGVTLLGFIVIYGVMKANGFNGYILAFGVVLLIPALIYFIIAKMKDKAAEKNNPIDDLKLTGQKIPVDLTKCEIISNSWTSEREPNKNSTIVVNELLGNSYDNRMVDSVSFSRIKFDCEINGQLLIFVSSPIAKDKVTLTVLLEMQQETFLYVDRDNVNYYYLDLEFLNS